MQYGAPGGIRTPYLMVRSHTLYPNELRVRGAMQRVLRAVLV